MTRKDYIAIAEALSEVSARLTPRTHEVESYQVMFDVINELAKTLKADNANFDTERFKDACWMVKV